MIFNRKARVIQWRGTDFLIDSGVAGYLCSHTHKNAVQSISRITYKM